MLEWREWSWEKCGWFCLKETQGKKHSVELAHKSCSLCLLCDSFLSVWHKTLEHLTSGGQARVAVVVEELFAWIFSLMAFFRYSIDGEARPLISTLSFTVFQATRKKSFLWGVETGLMNFSLGFTDGVSGKDNEQK